MSAAKTPGRQAPRPRRCAALAMGLLILGALGACGETDLVVPSVLPTPTAISTPTPAGCSSAGQFCDNVQLFCCNGKNACNPIIGMCNF